jgi:hypothetical protein
MGSGDERLLGPAKELRLDGKKRTALNRGKQDDIRAFRKMA